MRVTSDVSVCTSGKGLGEMYLDKGASDSSVASVVFPMERTEKLG